MRNDEVIKSIRYILDLDDARIAEFLKLAGYQPSREEVSEIFNDNKETITKIDGTEVEKDTDHKLTAHFLDGVIFHLRGKSDKHPPQPIQTPVTNNIVLKKLRVAFKLKDTDIIDILESEGLSISKTELSAFFRDDTHRNYKNCGDQVLRNFLRGLAKRKRGE
ncbi:DUF1456 family protein [Rhodohalobacter sp.]|uniref:DUF1456 family protein n=1 Tax=Rhodohalobacter sp. TaxID=1974210 RepID=UPI002ACE0588|nr:DUF1456 family protein [Rhodohalobacter sp.]MDZ7755857.1 DUF1456 family protein [Rhodohalobacter sp.]